MLIQPALPAKFTHDTGVGLRLQAFVLVRNPEGKVALLRLAEHPEGCALPGELLRLNEDPADGARRVARTWFTSPLTPRLKDVLSFPAKGGEDDKWYLLFVFEADAPEGGLQVPEDTLEVKWARPGEDPGPLAFAHEDVWARLKE